MISSPLSVSRLLFAGLLGLALAACGNNGTSTDDGINPPDDGALQEAARSVLEDARNRDDINGYALEIGTGEAIYARIAAGNFPSTDTRVFIASAGKPVSAAVIQSLVGEAGLIFPINPDNRLQLDEPIATYLGDTPAGNTAAAQEVTLRHLLNHSSGLQQQPDCVGAAEADPDTTLMDCATEILQAGTAFTPGTQFAYGGGSFQVAGAVAERFTGQSWQELVDERIAEPLGIALPFRPQQNPRVAGGIRANVADLGAFQRAVLTRDNAVLDDAEYDRFREPQQSTDGGRLSGVTASDYSFGFWIEDPDELAGTAGPELSSPGLFGATPWIDDDRGYYGVLLLRASDYATSLELMRELRGEILDRLN